jgi:hypothetical protein
MKCVIDYSQAKRKFSAIVSKILIILRHYNFMVSLVFMSAKTFLINHGKFLRKMITFFSFPKKISFDDFLNFFLGRIEN